MGRDVLQRCRVIQCLDQGRSTLTSDEHGGLNKISAHVYELVKFSYLSTYQIGFPVKGLIPRYYTSFSRTLARYCLIRVVSKYYCVFPFSSNL